MTEETAVSVYCCDIVCSEIYVEGRGNVTVYGLSIYNADPQAASQKGESCTVENISEDLETVRELKEKAEKYQLFPVHLKDVVDDFLSLSY